VAVIILTIGGSAFSNARGLAIESASEAFAGVQERVTRDRPELPSTGFVHHIDGGGLRIGWSVEVELIVEFA
jgi:hypothetical protein